jgi:hypothetical protein
MEIGKTQGNQEYNEIKKGRISEKVVSKKGRMHLKKFFMSW